MYSNIVIVCVLLSTATFGRPTTETVISSECREQFIQQTILRDQCHSRLLTPAYFYHEFNTTVIGFTGNDEDRPAVDEFFTEYCGIMPQFFQCFDISDDVSEICRAQIPHRQLKTIIFEVLHSLARYACENDADVLKKLLPHDGFKFFFFNDDFDRCVQVAREFQSTNDICLSLARSLPCIEETIGDHPNKDIIVIAREAFNRFEAAANCDN